MKRIFFLAIILISLNSLSKTLTIEAHYKGFSGKTLQKYWTVKTENECVTFFLDGKLKAKMYIKNGKITKIEEIKKFAGKERVFTVTKPEYIKLELRSGFIPFSFVYGLINKKTTDLNYQNKKFKLIEVKEQ